MSMLRSSGLSCSSARVWAAVAIGAGPFLLAPFPEVRKLNEPLAQPAAGDVLSAWPSPDGEWIVHVGDLDRDEVFELYSAPADGSTPAVKLNPDSIVGDVSFVPGGATPILISPDGTRVVYQANQESFAKTELYSVPIDGSSSAIKLNGPLVSGGNVQHTIGDAHDAAISPDGTRVVYIADQDTNDVFELFSVPIDRSEEPVKLNGTFVAGGDVARYLPFWIDAGGTRVVYLADQDTDEVVELYSVPIDGSLAPTKLNAPLVAGGIVLKSLVSADGLRVVYLAEQDTDGIAEAFSVPLDGSQAPTKLHADLALPDQVFDLQVTSDGSRVLLRAGLAPQPFRTKLFSVPIDGGEPPLEISGALGPGRHVQSFALSPDGERAIYYADQDANDVFELYSVPVAGGLAPIKLNHVPKSGLIESIFRVTPDSARVLYTVYVTVSRQELYSVPIDRASDPVLLCGGEIPGAVIQDYECSTDGTAVVFNEDRETDGVQELYRVPADGSDSPQKLSGLLYPRGDVFSSSVRIAGERVVYQADQDTNDVAELYSVPIDGSEPSTKLNKPIVLGPVPGDVSTPLLTPDGTRAVYTAMQGQADVQLFSVPLDVDAAPVQINDDFIVDAEVNRFEITPDGSRLVFLVHELGPLTNFRLYSAPIDGTSSAVELVPSSGTGFVISPDSSTVVFAADLHPDNNTEVYSIPTEGGEPPLELSGTLVAGGGASDPVVSPDGSRVVFRGDKLIDNRIELFSVPSDASQEPVRLNEDLAPSGRVENDYSITADGFRVVFLAQTTFQVFELYSAPIDASLDAVKLNGALASGGDVGVYEISPDGDWVVYRADQALNDVFELFSRPIDGGGSAVKLNAALPTGADVETFRVTPDGDFVLYLADQESDGRYGIFRVPIDGSASPEQVHPPMVPGGNPRANFRLSSDGAWVVYTADALENGVFELFSVPIGGGAPLELNGSLVPAGDVFDDFAISPDGSHVVYRADQKTDMVNELFRVPIDGRGPAVRVSAPLIPDGDVADFSMTAGAERIVYRADQETDEVLELYLSFRARALERHPGPVEVR